MFKTLSSKSVYKNKWMEVFEDEIEFSNGTKGIYGYVKRSDGAGVAILNEKSEILLVKQYRYPVKKMEWNIPGGATDGSDPREAAIREVLEETGIALESVEELYEGYPLSSCSTEKGYVYLARVENVTVPNSDVSEFDEYMEEKRFVPISEALRMIDSGNISDANTCNIIQIVARRLQIE